MTTFGKFTSTIYSLAAAGAFLSRCDLKKCLQRPALKASLLAVAFGVGAIGNAFSGQSALAQSNTDSFPVIDAHTHTEFSGLLEESSQIPMTREQYFKEWQEAGIVGAVAHTAADGSNFYDLKAQNVIYCAGVGDQINLQRVEDGLKTGHFGCIKIYLGYTHRYAYDPLYHPLYKLAEQYAVPVVFHTGDTYTPEATAKVKYADPLTIDEVAVDFPKVTFVIAHCGNPWIQSAAEVAYKNANVYLECSAFLIGNLNELPPEQIDTYLVQPIRWIFGYVGDPSKMMFGTDWPLVGMKAYLEAYKRAIPQEHWQAVFYGNAARVFKFKHLPGQGQ